MFWSKSRKISKLEEKISELERQNALRDAITATLSTQLATLRGAVNRKLGGRSKDTAEEETSEQQTDIEAIKRAFGGDVPIELTDKFNKTGNV